MGGFSRDGSALLTVDADGGMRLWDPATRTCRSEIPVDRFAAPCTRVCLSSDARRLATSNGMNRRVRVLDTHTGREDFPLEADSAAFAFSDDGRQLAVAGWWLEIYDVATGQRVDRDAPRLEVSLDSAFAPGARRLASIARDDQRLTVYDVATRRPLSTFAVGTTDPRAMVFSPDGERVALSNHGGGGRMHEAIRIWSASSGDKLVTIPTTAPDQHFEGLAFSPDGALIAAAGGEDRLVHVYRVDTGVEVHTFAGHEGAVRSVCWSPTGLIASGADDGRVLLWTLPGR